MCARVHHSLPKLVRNINAFKGTDVRVRARILRRVPCLSVVTLDGSRDIVGCRLRPIRCACSPLVCLIYIYLRHTHYAPVEYIAQHYTHILIDCCLRGTRRNGHGRAHACADCGCRFVCVLCSSGLLFCAISARKERARDVNYGFYGNAAKCTMTGVSECAVV